jgi:hypothetical protein
MSIQNKKSTTKKAIIKVGDQKFIKLPFKSESTLKKWIKDNHKDFRFANIFNAAGQQIGNFTKKNL